MKNSKLFLSLIGIAILSALLTSACTKDLTGSLPDYGTSTVVDGNIENGKPPIVLLTRSTRVFGDLNVNDLGSFFIHGAKISMTIDSNLTSIPLEELCIQNLALNDTQKNQLLLSLGITAFDSAKVPNVCAYTLPMTDLAAYFNTGSCTHCGAVGHTYHLTIANRGKTFTATTTIPDFATINSFGFKPNPKADSLITVLANISIPPTYGNFIRYWTKRNNEPYYTPYTGSVYDDKLFSGQTLTLPLERGIPSYSSTPDFTTFGYFWRGDSVTIKWAKIDSHTFDFFFTLENDGGGSPFSSPIRVKSNIVGDSVIGVWAGYAATYYTIVVPN